MIKVAPQWSQNWYPINLNFYVIVLNNNFYNINESDDQSGSKMEPKMARLHGGAVQLLDSLISIIQSR